MKKMIRIKSFNESAENKNEDIWIVWISRQEGASESEIRCFKTELLAADYFINWINHNYEKDYEPFFENGTRLFLTVDENEDYEKARDWFNEESGEYENYISIEIYKSAITKNSTINDKN